VQQWAEASEKNEDNEMPKISLRRFGLF